MTATAGYKASIYVTTTPSVPVTNVATTDAGDHMTYTISVAAERYWDSSQPVTVQTSPDGTSWTTASPSTYTVQYCGGVIKFASAITGATPSCRVSVSYLPYSIIGSATSADIQVSVDIQDVSTLGGGAWKTKLVTLSDSTIKLTQWWIDNFYLSALSNKMVISCYTGVNSNQRLEGFGYIKTDGIKIDVKSPIEESIDFEVTGALYSILS